MKKTKLTTTLNLLRKNNACTEGYRKLLSHVGRDYPPNKPISLLTVLESNGAQDMLWCLRATTECSATVSGFLGAEFAKSAAYVYREQYPKDARVEDCVAAVFAFCRGEITCKQLVAASDAASDAASAARAASYAASNAAYAASYAAYAASYAASAASAVSNAASTASYAARAARAASAVSNAASTASYAARAARAASYAAQTKIIRKYIK